MESTRAHFVEMHLVDGHAVGRCLGLGQHLEHAPRRGLRAFAHVGRLDDREDLGEDSRCSWEWLWAWSRAGA